MFEEAKKVCTEYADAKALVTRHKQEVAYFKSCVAESITAVEKFTFERELDRLAEKIGPAAEKVALYETAVDDVTGRPRLVLRQIYEECRKWKDVVDEDDVHLSESCIAADLKKGYRIMEAKIKETLEEYAVYLTGNKNAAQDADDNADDNADGNADNNVDNNANDNAKKDANNNIL